MEGDSESAVIRPSSATEARTDMDLRQAVRFDCLSLAQQLVVQVGSGDGNEVLELARQYTDFVLRGADPAPAGPATVGLDVQADGVEASGQWLGYGGAAEDCAAVAQHDVKG